MTASQIHSLATLTPSQRATLRALLAMRLSFPIAYAIARA